MSFYEILAPWYDQLFPTDPAAASLLTALLRRGQTSGPGQETLLDLGCGTGSLVTELCRRGENAWGTDRSSEMIAAGRQRDPRWAARLSVAAMEAAAAHKEAPFALVSCLGNTLAHLSSHDEVRRFVAGLPTAVYPQGAVVLQFVDVSALAVGTSRRLPELVAEGVSMSREYHRESPETIRFDGTLTVEGAAGGVGVTSGPGESQHHRTSQQLLVLETSEIVSMLQAAGLAVEAVTAGFSGEPLEPESWVRVITARAGQILDTGGDER